MVEKLYTLTDYIGTYYSRLQRLSQSFTVPLCFPFENDFMAALHSLIWTAHVTSPASRMQRLLFVPFLASCLLPLGAHMNRPRAACWKEEPAQRSCPGSGHLLGRNVSLKVQVLETESPTQQYWEAGPNKR